MADKPTMEDVAQAIESLQGAINDLSRILDRLPVHEQINALQLVYVMFAPLATRN